MKIHIEADEVILIPNGIPHCYEADGKDPWSIQRLACRLMDTTSLTIREVAIKSGYDDPYYFSRLFKKKIGQAPRDYRKMTKG